MEGSCIVIFWYFLCLCAFVCVFFILLWFFVAHVLQTSHHSHLFLITSFSSEKVKTKTPNELLLVNHVVTLLVSEHLKSCNSFLFFITFVESFRVSFNACSTGWRNFYPRYARYSFQKALANWFSLSILLLKSLFHPDHLFIFLFRLAST